MKLIPFVPLLFVVAILTACTSIVQYPPAPSWGSHTQPLGLVTADSGKWPLALNVPPPEYTYQAALRRKASQQFSIPEADIVLGEITVKFSTEMVGTIRSWTATSMAGRNTVASASAQPTAHNK